MSKKLIVLDIVRNPLPLLFLTAFSSLTVQASGTGKDFPTAESSKGIVANSIYQQNKKITGTITDASGEAIIGANVAVKGTTNGTITDMDGNFTLEIPNNAILQIR